MSTNPFRRSSIGGPSGSSGGNNIFPTASAPIDIPDNGADTTAPLTVKTKVPHAQKHVNFASPPAIPISPVSYPPSPESSRLSPTYATTQPILPAPTDYSHAIQSDPFRAEAGTDQDDGVIVQALQNAKANTTLVAPSLEASKQDAVRNTLSRFASAPRRPAKPQAEAASLSSTAQPKQAMDVDAFKRLLLTGDRSKSLSQEEHTHAITTHPPVVFADNSSGTDTASISQRSMFDQGLAIDESPRSSVEVDPADTEAVRQSIVTSHPVEPKKRPPPPTPRHGKPIKDISAPEPLYDPMSSQISLASDASKKPPAPPLARRRSQNSGVATPDASRRPSSGDLEQPSIANHKTSRAPPPPRSRRPVSMAERRSSSDLPITVEESDSADSSVALSRKSSDSRPALPPARNSSKRVSTGNMGVLSAPPPPPPRRGRGSSRSSVDSQRPPLSTILNDTESAGDNSFNQNEDHKVLTNSNANDILADLAALQREVDEARRRTSK